MEFELCTDAVRGILTGYHKTEGLQRAKRASALVYLCFYVCVCASKRPNLFTDFIKLLRNSLGIIPYKD
jgi:hypothetical protein